MTSTGHPSRPPLSKVAVVAAVGVLVGVVLAFPAVSRIARDVLGGLEGLGTIGLFVVAGSVVLVSVMVGLFLVWRAIKTA